MTGRCVCSSVGSWFDSVESFFFFFFPSSFVTLPLLALDLHFFLSTILFPFVFFLFYFLFPPFCRFSFSLSSLYFIFLISSSFSSPLSFSFFFFLFFFLRSHKMKTFCGVALYIAMTDQTGFCQIKLDFELPFWHTMYFALSFTL